MSEISSATALSTPVIINRPGGVSIEFPKLSPTDRLKLRAEFRLFRKSLLLQSLALCGVVGMDAVKVLNEFDSKRLPDSVVVNWINDIEGRRFATKLSLAKHRQIEVEKINDEELDALELSDEEMLTVAAGVCNVPLTPIEGGDRPLEPTGQTATGDATQTSSAATSSPPPIQ